MLVKSPMKKKSTKQNRRKSAGNGPANGSASQQKKQQSYGKRTAKKKKKGKLTLPKVAPWKIILAVITLGALGILYLSHVFATQQLLAEVQQMEQQYNQAKRSHDSYRLMYDRMIGPAEISAKAKELGFINGGPAEKVIEVEPE